MAMDRGCPGQDTTNWTVDDIFEVACPECGAEVEFFKDDARRRCPACGARVPNPRMDLGCAAWCAAADKCSVGRQWVEDGPPATAETVKD